MRKTRPPAQTNTGAWAGGILETTEKKVTKISQAKWDITKGILKRIQNKLSTSENNTLNFKKLESDRGYLIHVATTYKQMIPFLKGIHLTLDSWRPNQKDDGWKMSNKEWMNFLCSVIVGK